MLPSWLLPCFGRRAAAGVQRFEPPSSDGLSVRRCDERLRPILRSGSVRRTKRRRCQSEANHQGREAAREALQASAPAVRGLSQTAAKATVQNAHSCRDARPHNSFRSSWLYKNKVMAPCFGPLTGVTATVHPDSFHLIIFVRTRRRGLRDVTVAGAITVSDDALRRCLNRVVMGTELSGFAQVGGGHMRMGGSAWGLREPPDLNFSSARRRPQPSTARWNAWRGACVGVPGLR